MNAPIRAAWSAAVVAACTAPSAAVNVWPRLSHMIEHGAASGSELGITAALVMSVLVMTAVPFAMRGVRSWLEKLGILAVGLGLAAFNFSLAVDTAGVWRDSVTTPAALTAAKAAALKSRIEAATAARAQLPQVPHTSAAQATAAAETVAMAQHARDQECGKVGENCRKRVAELQEATDKRAAVLANRAVTEQLEQHADTIRKAQADLDALGVIPDQRDPAAARIAEAIGLVWDLGERGDLKVIKWWPVFIAIIVEALAMWGPRIVLAATTSGYGEPSTAAGMIHGFFRRRRREPAAPVAAPSAAVVAAVEPAGVRASPATPAKVRKCRKSNGAGVATADSVREWFSSRIVARAGSEVKPKETYDGSYVPWCREHKIEPVSMTKFGTIMKARAEDGGCGVEYVERSKRGFYVGIAAVGAPRLVAAGDGARASRLGVMARRTVGQPAAT